MLDTTRPTKINDIDLQALDGVVATIGEDPAQATVGFRVTTAWRGQTRSETRVGDCTIGGQRIARDFAIAADEPNELLGSNSAPNPQELLMAAVNACMLVGYVAGASVAGIRLDGVEIETDGTLDLRGFLGLSEEIVPGYRQINYTVRIRGDGTAAQFEEIPRTVMKTSPNYFNMANPIAMNGRLEVG